MLLEAVAGYVSSKCGYNMLLFRYVRVCTMYIARVTATRLSLSLSSLSDEKNKFLVLDTYIYRERASIAAAAAALFSSNYFTWMNGGKE